MTAGTVELHYRIEGPEDAPALVMASSLGTTMSMWDAQSPALSERFRLVRFDARGHGASPVPSGPYTMDDLGGDVLALMDRIGVERFSFAGLSIGGMVGMRLASEAPGRVEGLILLCTSARFDPPDAWQSRAEAVRAGGVGAVADAVLERWFTPAFRKERPEVVEWASRMLRATPPEGYAGCCEAIRDADLTPRLGRITAPTLVIAGADDPAAPVEKAEAIRDDIPDARLRMIERAAHIANVERPEEVTAEMLAHLESTWKDG
ncbi:MAG: 3-oxoadipate enol-lactonase [Actinomycetota bacterium]|nr:3-oxoadipate enol-lactonase [Actinomycetota bacterium]